MSQRKNDGALFSSTNTVEVRHKFDASADLLFEAWTTPGKIEEWWGPEGYTVRVASLELRIGSGFVFEMTSPNGSSCVMTGTWISIERPRRLAFELLTHCNLELPAGVPEQLEPALVVVQFLTHRDGCEVVLTHGPVLRGYDTVAAMSWRQVLSSIRITPDLNPSHPPARHSPTRRATRNTRVS